MRAVHRAIAPIFSEVASSSAIERLSIYLFLSVNRQARMHADRRCGVSMQSMSAAFAETKMAAPTEPQMHLCQPYAPVTAGSSARAIARSRAAGLS